MLQDHFYESYNLLYRAAWSVEERELVGRDTDDLKIGYLGTTPWRCVGGVEVYIITHR